MSALLIALVGAIYAVISIDQFYKSNPAMALTFAGYAFSNIGLYWAAK